MTVWQALCVYLKHENIRAKRAVHQKDSSHKYNCYSQTNYKLYSRSTLNVLLYCMPVIFYISFYSLCSRCKHTDIHTHITKRLVGSFRSACIVCIYMQLSPWTTAKTSTFWKDNITIFTRHEREEEVWKTRQWKSWENKKKKKIAASTESGS